MKSEKQAEKMRHRCRTMFIRTAAFCLVAALAIAPAYAGNSPTGTEEREVQTAKNGKEPESGFGDLFGSLTGNPDKNEGEPVSAASADYTAAEPGEIVTFGTWEQDADSSNGTEALEWIVLGKSDTQLLLITRYAIDCQPFHTGETPATWESCSLRTWLNGTFLDTAFTEKEQAMIPAVTVSAEKNPEYDTDPGNDTQDRVFLLSVSEAEACMGDFECGATAFAEEQGAFTSGDRVMDGRPSCYWWLRTPGEAAGSAVCAQPVGDLYYKGVSGEDPQEGVRPALCLALEP